MNSNEDFDHLDIHNINNVGEPMNLDNNILNEEVGPNLNLNNPDMEYMTDSDIEDPKYMPSGNVMQNQENNITQNPNLENIGVPSENQMLLQTQIMNLTNESILYNKTLQQLESENDQLKSQVMKNQEKIQSNEGINNEFKQLFSAFKQRFTKYEERNNYLQQYISQLEEKLKQKDIELSESLKEKNKSETALKNANIFKQYENELQNDFKEKSKVLNQKYLDKEQTLKNEFLDEINKNIQKIEDLKIENEKLKYDLSTFKMNIDNLNHQIEEKDYDKDSNVNQKEKEIIYLKGKIKEKEKE